MNIFLLFVDLPYVLSRSLALRYIDRLCSIVIIIITSYANNRSTIRTQDIVGGHHVYVNVFEYMSALRGMCTCYGTP